MTDEGQGVRGVTLAHNARERREVSDVLALAAAPGGEIAKPAQDVFSGGRSGYFGDPDGHLREGCWNPRFPLFSWPFVGRADYENLIATVEAMARSMRKGGQPT